MNGSNFAVETILSRRSIRRFDAARPIPREAVKTLLECACAAPSAHNYRPRHFIVIDKRETLDAIAKVHSYGKMLAGAPLAIAVCAETGRGEKKFTSWTEDCSAAMQNILLAATSMGIGSVWLGVHSSDARREQDIRDILCVPENIPIVGIAALGYPAEMKDPHSGIDAAALHLNKW